MTNLSIRDFFVDVSDPGLIKFYIDSVINYSNGVSSKIIEHDGFMPAVEKYSSLNNSISKDKFVSVYNICLQINYTHLLENLKEI